MSTANQRFMNQFRSIWNKNSMLPRNPIEAKRLFILKAFQCLEPHFTDENKKILPIAKKEVLDRIGTF